MAAHLSQLQDDPNVVPDIEITRPVYEDVARKIQALKDLFHSHAM